MKTGVIGLVISIIVSSVTLFLGGMFFIGIILNVQSQHSALSYTRNLVDEVIDSRVLTDDMIADYNLALASLSNDYIAEFYREVRMVNPDPANPGYTYNSYVITDETEKYKQGDVFTIKVNRVGISIYEVIARQVLGLAIREDEIILAGSVR